MVYEVNNDGTARLYAMNQLLHIAGNSFTVVIDHDTLKDLGNMLK